MNAPRFGSCVVLVAAALCSAASAQDLQPRMGQPVPGLTASELQRFFDGKTIFEKAFGPNEGRGPCFNDTACVGCHSSPAPGGASTKLVTRFGKKATGSTPFDPLASLGGSLLQSEANDPTNCQEVVPPEADVVGVRTTPPCFGFGLIEAIPDAAILVKANNPPPLVSGNVHMVSLLENPSGPLRVGRFGWKAQVATMLSFSGDASLNEMGLTNRLVGTENAPNGDLAKLAACDLTADPEDGPDAQGFDAIDRMADFQRFLAAPPQTPKNGMSGEATFNFIGCASCHTPSFTTGVAPEAALSNKTIRPYSDFLVHDIGTGDGIVFGSVTEDEFRTTYLWGLLPRAIVGLLHDISATGGTAEQNVDLAIKAHKNEALASKNNYLNLSAADQANLVNFLLSLGQSEFDYERDNDVDEFDWFFIQPTLTGPVPSFTPDSFVAISDVDQDGDFDLRDIGAFQRAVSIQ